MVRVCGSTRLHLPLIHHCRTLLQLEPHQSICLIDSSSIVNESFKESPVHARVTSVHLILLFQGLLCVICAVTGGGVGIQPYTSILPQVNNYVAAVKSKPVLITVTCP